MSTRRRALIFAFLALWVAIGPIGMAFDDCAWMCDGPCGLTTASISLGPRLVVVSDVVGAVGVPFQAPPAGSSSVLEPPPRPSALSA